MNNRNHHNQPTLGRAWTLLLAVPALTNAAELKQNTLSAWDQYVQLANSRMQERLRVGTQFLWIDEAPDRSGRVRAGEILVSPVGEHTPKRVPSGLIHHWIGAVFIPAVTIEDVFGVVRNYDRYSEFYKPFVIDARQLKQSASDDKFSIVFLNKALLAKTALDSEYESFYSQLDEKRWYSVAHTTRVQEISEYGRPGERELPPDEGSGYIWRLYSAARFEERDGGVYLELEAIALSRDIPASLRWLVDPLVRRASKGSLLTSLLQTQKAARSTADLANYIGGKPAIAVANGSAQKSLR
jgi:hypothetical protein